MQLHLFNCLAKAKKKYKYGILDHQGKIIVPIIYDEILNGGLNIFIVVSARKYGVINLKNETLIPVQFDFIRMNASIIMVRRKNKPYDYHHAIFDFTGQLLIPFKKVSYSLGKGSLVQSGSSSSFRIDKKGNRIQ